MPMNESKGNMYEWVTHTWNTIKGQCYHNCSYCYVKRWGKLNPVHFDKSELNTDLGYDNFIFVGSSCDMFAETIPHEWIQKTLDYCYKFSNQYLFQSKNPARMFVYLNYDICIPCTTIETNRWYPEFMGNTPLPKNRAIDIGCFEGKKYVTIEPIMDFDLKEFVDILKYTDATQINIGADSGKNNLPEPSKEKILELISELEKFTRVKQKSNLKRLLI
jgi:hypothetical protein